MKLNEWFHGSHRVADTDTETVATKPTADATTALSGSERFKTTVVLLLCAAGALAISQFVLIHYSLRLDESQSLWQTSHSVRGTLKVVAQDVHVPLYHLMLHYWQIIFGQSIEAARRLSLVLFLLSIPAVFALARRIVSLNWALFVTVMYSFSPFMNWYANEARMYTLLLLVTVINQLFFLHVVDSKGKRGWLGYALSAMVGAYTHYFFLFSLLAQGIYYILTRKRYERGTFWKFAGLAVLLIIELAPWLWYFHSLGSASNTSPNLKTPSSVDFVNIFSQFLFGFQNDALNTIVASLWPLLVLAALLGVRKGQKITPRVGAMIAILIPVLIAFAISYTVTPLFVSRYMIACLPAIFILGAWFISHYRRGLALSVAGLLLLAMGATSFQQYHSASTPVKEDYAAAAHLVSSQAKSSDIVVMTAPFTVYPFDYYYHGSARVQTLPEWDRTTPGAIPSFKASQLASQVNQLNKGHQYVYLILSYDQGYQNDIYQYYEHHFENPRSYYLSPGLQMQVYRVGYSQNKPVMEL